MVHCIIQGVTGFNFFNLIFFLLSILGGVVVFLCRSDNFDIRYCFFEISENLNWNLRILRIDIACEFFPLIKFSSINGLIPWSSVFVT